MLRNTERDVQYSNPLILRGTLQQAVVLPLQTQWAALAALPSVRAAYFAVAAPPRVQQQRPWGALEPGHGHLWQLQTFTGMSV